MSMVRVGTCVFVMRLLASVTGEKSEAMYVWHKCWRVPFLKRKRNNEKSRKEKSKSCESNRKKKERSKRANDFTQCQKKPTITVSKRPTMVSYDYKSYESTRGGGERSDETKRHKAMSA